MAIAMAEGEGAIEGLERRWEDMAIVGQRGGGGWRQRQRHRPRSPVEL